jgi:hypothetical protein
MESKFYTKCQLLYQPNSAETASLGLGNEDGKEPKHKKLIWKNSFVHPRKKKKPGDEKCL